MRTIDVILGFDDESFLIETYLLLLNRAPDPSGLSAYREKLDMGVSRLSILRGIAESPECRDQYGRRPEIMHWVDSLREDEGSRQFLTIPDVSRLLMLDGEEFIRATYKAVFHREPDEAGLVDYAVALRSGMKKARVLQILISSEEGRKNHIGLKVHAYALFRVLFG